MFIKPDQPLLYLPPAADFNGITIPSLPDSHIKPHSLLLMNSFNKTEAAVFTCRLCFLRAFPFISLLLLQPSQNKFTYNTTDLPELFNFLQMMSKCLCGAFKKLPHSKSLCTYIFLVFWNNGLIGCLGLGCQWCGIFYSHEQFQ